MIATLFTLYLSVGILVCAFYRDTKRLKKVIFSALSIYVIMILVDRYGQSSKPSFELLESIFNEKTVLLVLCSGALLLFYYLLFKGFKMLQAIFEGLYETAKHFLGKKKPSSDGSDAVLVPHFQEISQQGQEGEPQEGSEKLPRYFIVGAWFVCYRLKYPHCPWIKEYVKLEESFANMTVKNVDGSFVSIRVLEQEMHDWLVKKYGTSICQTSMVILSIHEVSEQDYRDFTRQTEKAQEA